MPRRLHRKQRQLSRMRKEIEYIRAGNEASEWLLKMCLRHDWMLDQAFPGTKVNKPWSPILLYTKENK